MLNFNHVYYFYIAASEGSIKAAAEKLGITQPTVSEQLRVLERSLGVELFERTGSGLKLTAAGRAASHHAASFFCAAERMLSTFDVQGATAPRGLRVGVSTKVALTTPADFLIPLLSVRRRASIRVGYLDVIMRDLRSGGLDLVITEAEPADLVRSHLAVELICLQPLAAIAHPEIEPTSNWGNLSVLAYPSGSVYAWEIEMFLRSAGLEPAVVGEIDDAFLMLEAVLRGGLVAFVPHSIARVALDEQRVKQLATFNPRTAGVYAVYPSADARHFAHMAVQRL